MIEQWQAADRAEQQRQESIICVRLPLIKS